MHKTAWLGAFVATALLASCGGSGNETAGTPEPAPASILSGAVVKGPVAGAQVCAYALAPTGKGGALGCTTSRQDGGYLLSIDFEGAVVVEASGGSYLDEATAAVTPLANAMSSVAQAARGQTRTVAVTPLTHFAYAKALPGGLSTQTFAVAAGEVRAIFEMPAVDLVGSLPVVAPGADNAYGAALRTLSNAFANGAQWDGVVQNLGNAATQAGLRRASWCTAGPDGFLKDWNVLIETPIGYGLPSGEETLAIAVDDPAPSWRGEIPSAGPYLGCEVTTNTTSHVALLCPSASERGSLSIHAAGAAASYATPATTAENPLRTAGRRIRLTGGPVVLSTSAQVVIAAGDGIIHMTPAQLGPAASMNIQGAGIVVGGTAADFCRLEPTGAGLSGGPIPISPLPLTVPTLLPALPTPQ